MVLWYSNKFVVSTFVMIELDYSINWEFASFVLFSLVLFLIEKMKRSLKLVVTWSLGENRHNSWTMLSWSVRVGIAAKLHRYVSQLKRTSLTIWLFITRPSRGELVQVFSVTRNHPRLKVELLSLSPGFILVWGGRLWGSTTYALGVDSS